MGWGDSLVGSDTTEPIAGAMVSFLTKKFLCNGCVGEIVYEAYSTEGRQCINFQRLSI